MNGHTGIDTFIATEHLKNILNVGKSDTESGKLKSASNGAMEVSGDTGSVLHDGSYQKIELCTSKGSSHVAIYGTETDIYSSPLEYATTCSQVMVENMVDYGWEEKYHYGKMVNVHLSGLYLAYVLKPANNKPGYVRIIRNHLNLRHLIRDYKTEVKDIAFAHTTSQVLLGSIDACGEFLVHKITDDGSTIQCNLVIRILRPANWTPSEYNRIIWCLYIPDDTDNGEEDTSTEDVTTLLVVTHNEKAEIWNIDTIIKEHGHGNLTIDEVKLGVQIINEHKMPITSATFSPDGTALAISNLDGVINFFQVVTPDKSVTPRCLHKWIPHDNKPLSTLYFLDNHKNHRPEDQFWKFAITGAENNTEIKLWSCESWKCLQTIRIHPNSGDSVVPNLKAEIDHSSKYLFLSDIKRKVILILLIHQDVLSGTAMICSLSEYRVNLPILSLVVSGISYTRSNSLSEDKNSDDEVDKEQMGDTNDADESFKYIFKLFWIQTKALQSAKIYYQPKLESPLLSAESVSSLSQDSYVFKDGLSDISLDIRDTSSRSGKDLDTSLTKSLGIVDEISTGSQPPSTTLTSLPPHISTYSNCSEVLLTPDDFTSPSHSNLSAPNSFSHHDDTISPASKCDSVSRISDGVEALPVETTTLIRRKSSQHSATSSPSREVAEILAPIKILNIDEIATDTSKTHKVNEVETVSNGLENFNLTGVTGISRNQTEFNVKDWPQAPDHSKNFRIAAMNESELLGPTHFQADNVETSDISLDISSKLLKFSHSIDEILQKMNSLSDVVHDQRCDIQSLQTQIKMLREDQMLNQQNENTLPGKLENTISQSIMPHYSRLENLLLKKAEEERRRTERELVNISNEISSTFSTRLETTLKQELSSNVIPQLNRVIDTIAQKMQSDFNQKLGQTDASLKDSFSKHLKGKPFMDSIAQSVSTALQGIVQTACREIFQNSVVPSFDKASQQLFQQLNEVFLKGTAEYLQVFERCSQQSCSSLESAIVSLREEVGKLISGAQQAINAQTLKFETHSSDMIKQQEALLASIRQVVQEETRKILREQQNAVLNSRSTTPVPLSDPQLQKQHVMQLVRLGNFNDAFQEALSAMDVQLVLFLCESVHCDQVFGPIPCPLQQHVLLSLVNQLSADLSVKTEIKVRYLEEVIASLDINNPLIREHVRNVLESLQQRIGNFLSRYPTHKLARCLRRISMAVDSLIK